MRCPYFYVCEFCRQDFDPGKAKDRFCSKSCAARWHWQNRPWREAIAASNRRRIVRPQSKYLAEVQARLAAIQAARREEVENGQQDQ